MEKENEKIKNYQDLKWELKRIWICQEIVVIPVVSYRSTEYHLKKTFRLVGKVSTNAQLGMMQKAC